MRKVGRPNQEPKYSLEEIAHNKELFKKILQKSQLDEGEPQVVSGPRDDLDNLTKENLLPRERASSLAGKKNPLNRKEKHNREVQALLLMDAILDQTSQFTAKEKIVDFAKVFSPQIMRGPIDFRQHHQHTDDRPGVQALLEEAQGEN